MSTEFQSTEQPTAAGKTAATDASDAPVADAVATHSQTNHAVRHTPVDLPSPEERPDADVVIYDGKCVFCERQVRNLLWFDGGKRLSYMSLHDPEVTRRYPELTYDQMMKQMYVVDGDGNQHGGAAAIRYLSRRLPKLWLLAPLTHIPFTLPIQQWCYDQVAKQRYKIAGKQGDDCDGGTCSIHFGDKKD